MLKAKLDSVRKNKKGFSLVELIIVIAIMVALIAVMAPAFVKYVAKSRDAALASAAEDFQTACQTYIADPDTAATKQPSNGDKIVITAPGDSPIVITYDGTFGDQGAAKGAIEALAGIKRTTANDFTSAVDGKKLGASKDTYTITFSVEGTQVSCNMAKTTAA